MITATTCKINKIIEAAGDTVNTIVQSICNPLVPAWTGFTHNPHWLSLFPCLTDLNVITQTGNDYLGTSEEFPDRFPFAAFYIDEVINDNPRDCEETYTGSLGVLVGVERERFGIALHELFEIQTAIRSIMMMDKQFGKIHRGVLKQNPGTLPLTGRAHFEGDRLIGTGTLFIAEASPGDWVALDNDLNKYAVVDSVTNNTELILQEPYRGTNQMESGLVKVRYVKHGAVVDVIKWMRFTNLSQPESDENAEGIFLQMNSFYQIWFKEQWIGEGSPETILS